MKSLKTILYGVLIVVLVYAAGLTATIIGVNSAGGVVSGATATSYGTVVGNLIISLPEPVAETQKGEMLLTAGTETSIGKLQEVTKIDDYMLVTVQTGEMETTTNTYTVQSEVQKVVTQIPVIGLFPGIFAKGWVNTIPFIIFITAASLILVFHFFRKKPTPPAPVQVNQIGVLQELYDAAPEPPSKEQNSRRKTKA